MGGVPVKRVLMIAYHFPPMSISSGIQRTLKFSTYLPESGWEAGVLTIAPRAYASVRDDQMHEIPQGMEVRRAFGLDTARHLSIRGRYPRLLALPDKWSSWWFGGVLTGLRMIREFAPDVLWSTYPIATAHLIGLTLHRLTRLPWVTDFRDPMTEDDYPPDRTVRSVYRWIESRAVRRSARVVLTNESAAAAYRARYSDVPQRRWEVIGNGYDEANFAAAEAGSTGSGLTAGGATGTGATRGGATRPLLLVHSGLLYPSERDPTQFFDAIAALKRDGTISAERLQVRLRGTRYDDVFRPEIEQRDIADIVRLEPPIAYESALHEMLSADGLLILQAANCNDQVPAKLYEFFRARRPILGLTDPAGATAGEMRGAGIESIAALDDVDAIREALIAFLRDLESGSATVALDEAVARSSRRARTVELAGILDQVLVESNARRRGQKS